MFIQHFHFVTEFRFSVLRQWFISSITLFQRLRAYKMDPKTRLEEKRNIPQPLQKLLALDVDLTKRFVSFSLNFVPIRSLKTHCKFLEVSSIETSSMSQIVTWKLYCMVVFFFSTSLQYSCHGLVWLVVLLAACWFFENPSYYQTQMNLLIGLILDIVLVASIKAATRRRRPTINDDLFSIGPDKFR